MVIFLLLVIGGVYGGKYVYDKYSYGKERADLNEYFNMSGPEDVAIILQDTLIEDRAVLEGGRVYFKYDLVQRLFTDSFYHNSTEEVLLYTMPTYVEKVNIGTSILSSPSGDMDLGYTIAFYKGDELYLAADFVKKYANFSCEAFEEPARVQIYNQWDEYTQAAILKDTWVRYRGGIKSEILCDLNAGDTVRVLEKLEDWSKVKANGGFIGYVENKRLSNEQTVSMIPVNDVAEPDFTHISVDHKINMAWHQVMVRVGAGEFRSATENTKGINVISPTWFSISSNSGDVADLASGEYVEAAHAKGMQVWALVDNDLNKLYGTDTTAFLSSTAARNNAVSKLMEYADRYDLDGINVDFETVKSEAGEDYIQFIRELSVACRNKGLVLSVDNYPPTESSRHYHRGEQGKYADYVVIMGYDEHWGGMGVAGSVASIGYVENGIANTIAEGVPAERIINGIPFYARVWKTNGGTVTSEALAMDTQQEFIRNNNLNMEFDGETCQNYGEIMKGDTLYQIWAEDAESIQTKLNVMDAYRVAGVAEWKLGLETASIWNVIEEYLKR